MNKKNKKLSNMTFNEHYAELRKRLVYCVIFFILTTTILFTFSEQLYGFFTKPLGNLMLQNNPNAHLIYTKLTEGFTTEIKMIIYIGIIISTPFFIYQFYRFISPGLYIKEKKIVIPYLFFSPILFGVGVIIVYYIIIPITWKFFLSFEVDKISDVLPIKLEAKISEYFDLILEMIIGFGLAFQLPLVLALLSKLGLVNYQYLNKFRKYAIVIIFIAAAVLTPPDVLSQIILALPLMLLYEISILVCRKIENTKKKNA